MEGRRDTEFARWLRGSIQARDLTVRGLARTIAERSVGGATERNVETTRRALNKYLLEGRRPSVPMRQAIARALGVAESELPEDGDDEEADPVAALEAIQREQHALVQRTTRVLKTLRRVRA